MENKPNIQSQREKLRQEHVFVVLIQINPPLKCQWDLFSEDCWGLILDIFKIWQNLAVLDPKITLRINKMDK